jgi:hypothetical protein
MDKIWIDSFNLFAKVLGTVPECIGCDRYIDYRCRRHPYQEHKQHTRIYGCASRTHNREDEAVRRKEEFKLNPLKASKRSRGK